MASAKVFSHDQDPRRTFNGPGTQDVTGCTMRSEVLAGVQLTSPVAKSVCTEDSKIHADRLAGGVYGQNKMN